MRATTTFLRMSLTAIAILGVMACGGEETAPDQAAVPGDESARGEATSPGGLDRASDTAGAGAGLATWTNDRSRLAGDKLVNFVPFTFHYPAAWRVLEDGTGETPNFVKVERATEDGVTIENLAVGWYAGMPPGQVLDVLEPQFASAFPLYRKLSEGPASVDGVASREFHFEATVDTSRGPVTFWGRTLAVPVDSLRGAILVLFASEMAPEVDGPGDVGEAGELGDIMESFRLGDG